MLGVQSAVKVLGITYIAYLLSFIVVLSDIKALKFLNESINT